MNLPDTHLIERTKGFLDPDEGMKLFEIATEASRLGPCLEIGSYCGKSAIYLGTACKNSGNILFSVDHHRGSEEQQPGETYFDPELMDVRSFRMDTFHHFRKTLEMAGLEDTVAALVCRSETAARAWATPLSLVFIDGGHALETVRTDYRLWAPHILPGGFLLMHDIFPNPEDGGQAPYEVYLMAKASGLFEERPMTKSLGILQRNHRTGALI